MLFGASIDTSGKTPAEWHHRDARCFLSGLIVLRQIAGFCGQIDAAAVAMHEIAILVFRLLGMFDALILRGTFLVDARRWSRKIS
ncbi:MULTISPECIES: hypothetical protein [Bradyrhizobium]|uniref:Transposase n=1 Tax=Bradyrhizobium vignae TaxID=1549949 RepID=A0ABS4A103_9BRAD|nr:hypothetical protein [Bradyrhizobium vignae]MBP0113354.1 hypothetical protein [Bradyrhizobium vignae]